MEQIIVQIEKSLDKDRYITYEQFVSFIKEIPKFSKAQCFYLLLGITGFRPCEVARLTTENLKFEDSERPIILNKITKTKKKVVYDNKGRVIYTKIIKTKERNIPLWVKEYIEEYLIINFNQLKISDDGFYYLFSSPYSSRKKYIDSNSWGVDINKKRKQLFLKFPDRFAWGMEIVSGKNVKGCVQPVRRLSLYSFRKMRATIHGMQMLEAGISDVLLCVSQFMGHEKLNTTYKYVKNLISDHFSGVQKKPAPNLAENIFAIKKEDKLNSFIKKLIKNEEFLRLIKSALNINS